MEELQIGINGRVSRRSQGGGKPRLHGWAFRSYIVGLTLAVNLWACDTAGRSVPNIVGLTLAVNLWACDTAGRSVPNIVGLTLAVNLWACGQPVGLRSTCGLAVNLWPVPTP